MKTLSATKRGPGRRAKHGKPCKRFVSRWATAEDFEAYGVPVPEVLPELVHARKRARREARRRALRRTALRGLGGVAGLLGDF